MAATARLTALCGVLLVAVLHGHAQQQMDPAQAPQPQARPSEQPTPTFRGGINFVRVDVIVADKSGAQVSDLKLEDFEVTEDGKRQTIETFKLIEYNAGRLPGADGPPRAIRTDADEEAEAGRDHVRLFAIYLDDYHVRRETGLRAREELARFVETELGPADMIGVMYPLQPLASLRFTRDHASVARGLRAFEGRKYDYVPRNQFEQIYANYPTEVVEKVRNEVSLGGLNALIIRMGGLKEGRKALILLSEGYSNYVPPQLRSSRADSILPDVPPAARLPTAGTTASGAIDPNETRAEFFANADLDVDLRDLHSTANRSNVAIYSLDPRGLAAGEFGIDQNIHSSLDRNFLNATMETLRSMSRETDGRAIINRNDLGVALRQIVRDSSAYYLLGYSTQAPPDGKFREIKVRIRRPNVQVRARRGYVAARPEEAAKAAAPVKEAPKVVSTALAAITAPPRGGRVVTTWIGTERGENGKTKVTFLWEPAKNVSSGRERSQPAQPARVSLTAAGANGTPYFRGRVAAPQGPATAPTQGPARVTFEADPGVLQLRFSVEDVNADVLDSATSEFTVPDLNSQKVALATPLLFSARTVRQFEQLKGDLQAVPTLSREFARTERLLVRLTAYGPGTAPPSITARLLSRGGEPMNDLSVSRAGGTLASVELPLASMAPGEYVLEIVASGEGGSATELIAFRVTG
jgi:VWFA-related protein